MSKLAKLIVNFALIAILVIGMIVGNVIIFRYEQEVSSLLSPPIVDNEAVELSSSTGQAMSKRIMEEGAVLLKNENNCLPLNYAETKNVNVFGWRSIDWIYGSEGQNASGGVAPEDGDFSKNVDIYKALNSYGINYNKRLYDMYYDYKKPDHQSANLRGTFIGNLIPLRDPKISDKRYYSDDLLEYSKNYSDTALVVLGRMAGEAMNCSPDSQTKTGPGVSNDNTRQYMEISTEEEELLTWCGANFEKVIVLLNMANPFECGFLETIPGLDACMYIGFTGTRGASALPSLLYGDVSPSGRTVDTFAYDLFTNPGNVFLDKAYTDYGDYHMDIVENIYIGYKWYETADAEGVWAEVNNKFGKGYEGVVQFPFGFGKSYTDFEWTVNEISVAPGSDINANAKINFKMTVKNTGTVAGRETVQIYLTAPYTDNGIEKSYVSLVGFNKTNVIEPGKETEITVETDAYDFLSYDCYDKNKNGFKGYELEKGTYTLKLMTDSHTVNTVNYEGEQVEGAFDFNVPETITVANDPVTGSKVGNLFTGEDAVDATPIDANDGSFTADIPWFTRKSLPKPEQFAELNKARACTPSAKFNPADYSAKAAAWDSATTDEFGDPVNNSSVTWNANNGKKLAVNGIITDLGKKLGADYDDPEWDSVLDQLSPSEVVNLINRYYGSKEINSVGKPYLKDLDGPAQIGGFSDALPRGTGYPTMVVIAQTWNPNLAYEFGKAYGDDMKAVGCVGVWGWAIDLHRSSLFGRNHESPSEDPVLCGVIISNAVKGLGTRGRYSFLKHFALYGYGGSDIWLTEQALRENYLRPFRKAFVEGGALGCMTTYQGVGAEHSETTVALLTGVLRKEWKFKGAITTDYIGTNAYCDSIIRCGGNFGMGVNLSIGAYNEGSSNRLQNRLRESAKQVLYMWLRADYNERQYLANPDKAEVYIASTSINSWSWWQPLVYSLDVVVSVGCALWAALVLINVFMKSPDKRKAEDGTEGGEI